MVVNDLGGSPRGEGADRAPAEEVAEVIRSRGGEAVANFDDVSSFEGARNMVQQAVDDFGGLDVLVNNAGILRDRMIFNMDEDDWDAVIKVHLRGHYAPARHACEYWRNRAKEIDGPVHASVVCTSSLVGLEGNIGQTNYAAAKGGIAMFTIALALEMERYGVRANCVAPSGTTRLITMTQGTDAAPLEPDQYTEFNPAIRQRGAARHVARVRPVASRHRPGVPFDRLFDHALPPVDTERHRHRAGRRSEVVTGGDRRRARYARVPHSSCRIDPGRAVPRSRCFSVRAGMSEGDGDRVLEDLLVLEELDTNLYRAGNPAVQYMPHLYGGQVAAQALRAAAHTVPDGRHPHSIHGYFLRGGRPDRPTIMAVDRDRDGGSFSARHVNALQDGEVIFSALASFHADESGVDHQLPELPDDAGDPDSMPEHERLGHNAIFDMRYAVSPNREQWAASRMWSRPRRPLPDDRVTRACALDLPVRHGVGVQLGA